MVLPLSAWAAWIPVGLFPTRTAGSNWPSRTVARTPAEIAQLWIDFADWLQGLPSRRRRLVTALASGASTGEAAQKFGVTPGRVSQIRRELAESWAEFIGEPVIGKPANARPATPREFNGTPAAPPAA